MILSCNSCEKKFVVPDNAILASGRLVQCSACGNKWKQFPIRTVVNVKEEVSPTEQQSEKNKNNQRITKKVKKKKKGPNLYSPEYLEKKHGLNIKKPNLLEKGNKNKFEDKVYFGFISDSNSKVFNIFLFKFAVSAYKD